jgi:hypothetical protein
MEAFEFKGLWWLPQKPDHQVAGILKFSSQDGTTLDLIGDSFKMSLFDLFSVDEQPLTGMKFLPSNIRIETICGNTENGEEITLYNCWEVGENISRGYGGASYGAQVVFIGCHFKKEKDIVFDKISVGYNVVQDWLGVAGFTGKIKTNRRKGIHTQAKLNYKLPKRIEMRIRDFKLTFYADLRLGGNQWSDIHLKQNMFIEIKPDKSLHYLDYHSIPIYNLRNFMSFATGSVVLPTTVTGQNKKFRREVSQKRTTVKDVYIYYSAKGNQYDQKNISQTSMLFLYRDIAENLESYLQKWFELSQKIRDVIDLYFGIFYSSSIYPYLELLTLAQAIEIYHRTIYGGTYMTPENYSSIAQTISAAIPNNLDSDHRESLKSKIKWGYEYSLRKRISFILKSVLLPYKKTLDLLVGDYKTFIAIFVDTRNHITHHDPTEIGLAITDPYKQAKFAEQIKLFMQLCFFAELGIDPDLVYQLMLKNGRFRQFCVSLPN